MGGSLLQISRRLRERIREQLVAVRAGVEAEALTTDWLDVDVLTTHCRRMGVRNFQRNSGQS